MSFDEDYESILTDLKSKWLLAEIDHTVSKRGSEAFWKIGLEFFPKLFSAYGTKRTSQFNSMRRKMYRDLLPTIDIEIGYKEKATGQIIVVKDTITPIKRFPPSRFEQLYEIGKVKVMLVEYTQYHSYWMCSRQCAAATA